MVQNAIPHFPCKVQSLTVLLQDLHDTNTLTVMSKTTRMDLIKRMLPCMPKWCMSKIMSERDRLHQIFIQAKCLGYRACDLRYLKCMREPVPVMVPVWCKKHLCLILQSAKCLAVENPVTVSLINGPDIAFLLGAFPASGMNAARRIWTQKFQFLLFHLLPYIHRHYLHRCKNTMVHSNDKIPYINYILHNVSNSSFFQKKFLFCIGRTLWSYLLWHKKNS